MNICKKINVKSKSIINNSFSVLKTFFYNNSNRSRHSKKDVRIFDIFIFYNELELLELRLNILGDYVDHFVIVESTKTFSGANKPLYFYENKDKFKKWEDKIIHYITEDTPDSDHDKNCDQQILKLANNSDQVPKGQTHWLREFYQKEMMKKPLLGKAQDEDFCFVSDIDEIWNPESRIDFSENNIFKFEQNVYAYYLNNRSNEPWHGTFATKYKNIKNNSLTSLDSINETVYIYIKNGGWHFTNMGGVERIQQKIRSYGHQEFNNEENLSKISERMKMNEDFVGRGFKFWVEEKDLPKYILDNKEKYKQLFKE